MRTSAGRWVVAAAVGTVLALPTPARAEGTPPGVEATLLYSCTGMQVTMYFPPLAGVDIRSVAVFEITGSGGYARQVTVKYGSREVVEVPAANAKPVVVTSGGNLFAQGSFYLHSNCPGYVQPTPKSTGRPVPRTSVGTRTGTNMGTAAPGAPAVTGTPAGSAPSAVDPFVSAPASDAAPSASGTSETLLTATDTRILSGRSTGWYLLIPTAFAGAAALVIGIWLLRRRLAPAVGPVEDSGPAAPVPGSAPPPDPGRG